MPFKFIFVFLEALSDLCVIDIFRYDFFLHLFDILLAFELFLNSIDLHVHKGDHIFCTSQSQ
jgi:hypothetical protein